MNLYAAALKYVKFLFVWALLWGFTGCGGGPDVALGPPEGWTGQAGLWWQAGTDTTVAFRNVGDFEAMGSPLEDVVYGRGTATTRQQLVNGVKREFMPMFQSNPELVDSLFTTMGRPKIMRATLKTDLNAQVDELSKDIFRSITRHYQQPRTLKKLGSFDQAKIDKDIVPISQPDSLKAQGVYGRVQMQVYLNPEGEPLAVKVLDPVHPVLDDLAQKAATQMRWRPAYLRGKGVYGWALFNVNFQAPS